MKTFRQFKEEHKISGRGLARLINKAPQFVSSNLDSWAVLADGGDYVAVSLNTASRFDQSALDIEVHNNSVWHENRGFS